MPLRVRLLPVNLSDIIAMPDTEAAAAMNERMALLDHIHRIHERSYAERGIIVREFERRQLWQHLTDQDTGQPFPNFTAWISCSDFLGCRRVNFEAKRDMEMLKDVPAAKLIDVPKGNLKVLTQLSTAVRNDPGILEAAKTLPQNEFLAKVETDQPQQHIETQQRLIFSPGRSGAKVIEEMIAWALEHDIAGSRNEAIVRAAETALHEWELEEELRAMPDGDTS